MQWKKEEKREKTERKEKRRGGELKRPRIQEWEIFSYQAIPLYEILKLYTNKTYRAPSLWVGRLRLRESPNLSFLRSPAQKPTPPSSLWYLQGILERAAPTTNNLFCARYCPKCFVSGSYFISQQPCVSSSASSGWETLPRPDEKRETWRGSTSCLLYLRPKQSGSWCLAVSLLRRLNTGSSLQSHNRNKGWSFQSKRSKCWGEEITQETSFALALF